MRNDPIAPLKKEMDDIVKECFNGKIPDEKTKEFLDEEYKSLLVKKYEDEVGEYSDWAARMRDDEDEIIKKLEESIRSGKALLSPDMPGGADY